MDFFCLISAACFFTGNLLRLIFYRIEYHRGFDYQAYKQFDPTTIENEWEFRMSHRPKLMSAAIINSLAWFLFCFPIFQLTWALHTSSSSTMNGGVARYLWLHTGVIILTLGGAFTEWTANLLYIGATFAFEWMVKDFELETWVSENDQIGLRVLELTHIAIRGMNFWVDAFEWIVMFFVMSFLHAAVRRYRQAIILGGGSRGRPAVPALGAAWNALSLMIGLLSLLDFIAEVLRVTDYRTFSTIAFWYGVINRLILLPLWLVWLARNLPVAINQACSSITSKSGDVDNAVAAVSTDPTAFEQDPVL